jgi:hypothetical protein
MQCLLSGDPIRDRERAHGQRVRRTSASAIKMKSRSMPHGGREREDLREILRASVD